MVAAVLEWVVWIINNLYENSHTEPRQTTGFFYSHQGFSLFPPAIKSDCAELESVCNQFKLILDVCFMIPSIPTERATQPGLNRVIV